jgi:hypothetical protein
MRNKIFDESKEIRSALISSKNSFLLVTMFDSCIQSTSQLDAYFYMLGLFNSIRRSDLNTGHTDFLISWLSQIKSTNELVLRSLTNLPQPIDSKALLHVKKMQKLFGELNALVDTELKKVVAVSKAAALNKKKK